MEELSFTCEDIIIAEDNVEMSESDKEIREKVDKRDRQLKRWFMTINNPFFDPDVVEEVDMNENTLPVKYDYYNLEFVKSFNNVDLFDFHYVKVTAKVDEIIIDKALKEVVENIDGNESIKLIEVDIEKTVKVEKEFVVERPYFKDYECLKTYIENLEIEGLKYAVGQIEKGEQETIHLQAGLIFDDKHGKRFYTMKKYFPTAYLDKVRGSNYDVKVYCTKEDTRIMPPFEIGKFSEMRARTDYEEFKAALKSGASDDELMENFYSIVAQVGLKNIQLQRDVYMQKEYANKCRNIEVTYIYGHGGVGKTRSVYRGRKFDEVFKMTRYGQFAFHGYKYQKILLMDEFIGQPKLQTMNNWLDNYPLDLEIKGGSITACYDKVYIVSNIPYSQIYKEEQTSNIDIFRTFDRRIHHIFEVNDKGEFIKKRETIFEDIPDDEIEAEGWTKRVSKVVQYTYDGEPYVVYDLHKVEKLKERIEQCEIELVGEVDEYTKDLLFGDDWLWNYYFWLLF